MATLVLAVVMNSCNKPMVAPQDLKCNPSPLTVVGDKVNASITGTFPAKTFNKKGTLVVTPVLKFNGQEVKGEPTTFIGEKVKANDNKISYANGGKYDVKVSFDYVPEMAQAELYLQFEATAGKKTFEVPEVKVADGVVSTVKLASADAKEMQPSITPDKFQRIIQEIQEADIKFLIQQANLRSSETNSANVKDLTAAIVAADTAQRKAINNLEVAGYASPDGALELNEGLAQRRQKVSADYLAKQLKRKKVNVEIDTKFMAEDWEGFQKLMEASSIQDKDLILRVLSMYSDPEQREREIKNLSAAYKSIADEILPPLRRARLKLTTDLIGKSDEEISKLIKEDPKQLSVEEMLYAATLTQNLDEKVAIYQKVIDNYPNEYRGYNNMGITKYAQGKVDEAVRCYAKALELQPNDPDVNYNAGVAAMEQGDLEKAEVYFGKAAGTKSDLGAALGTLYMMKGDYSKAKTSFGKANTNNAALQQILNEDYSAARNTLAAVAEPNATTAYLAAVIGARTNDREAVYSNMKTAVARDAAMKEKAAKDIEFAKFADDEAFKAIIK